MTTRHMAGGEREVHVSLSLSLCRYKAANHERSDASSAAGGSAGREGLYRRDAHPEGFGHGGVL